MMIHGDIWIQFSSLLFIEAREKKKEKIKRCLCQEVELQFFTVRAYFVYLPRWYAERYGIDKNNKKKTYK